MPTEPIRRSNLLKRVYDRLPMGPRKKVKQSTTGPAPDDASAPGTPAPQASDHIDAEQSSPARQLTNVETKANSKPTDPAAAQSESSPTPGLAPRKSWYSTGTWRVKAAPIAQVAKESISSAAGGVTSDSSEAGNQESGPSTPARLLSSNRRNSSKSTAIAASTTKIHAISDRPNDSSTSLASEPKDTMSGRDVDPPLPPDPVKEDDKLAQTAADVPEQTQQLSGNRASSYMSSVKGWYGWWSRPDGYPDAKDVKTAEEANGAEIEAAKATSLPGVTPIDETPDPPKQMEEVGKDVPAKLDGESTKNVSKGHQRGTTSKSWFWLWSSQQNAEQSPEAPEPAVEPPKDTPEVNENADSAEQTGQEPTQETRETQEPVQESTQEPPDEDKPIHQEPPKKSAGWAFWSRSQPKDFDQSDAASTHKQIGELAVADTPSQSHPEAAQFNEHRDEPPKEPKQTALKSIRGSLRGRGRGKSKQIDSRPETPVKAIQPESANTTPKPGDEPKAEQKATEASPTTKKQTQKAQPQAQANPNLLLPEFKSTYRMAAAPSYWDKIRHYFLGGHEPESPHLHIAKEPPKVRKALAIGIHGYFPAAILQRVLGPPTGTSIRFANAAAEAVERWTLSQGYRCETEKIALEGEGFVGDRVDTLWKLLLNWIDHIRHADFILVACHSQGVPVAIMLVAKLIQFGCVNAARIGVCAMAGVNLGPFPEYRSRFFGGSAGELFEFSRPNSTVSQKYQGALRVVLNYGVRIVYVGSIDDQLVSLESSTFSNISHPYIYRAVFVDGRIHAPDFITHLVGFVLKLRNLGLPDHGLIRELSPALAGSLYSGEGHSRIYDDPNVYALAVQHALHTTSLPANTNPSLIVKDYDGVGTVGSNPYFLPWAMRGLLEEDFVRKELSSEVEDLLALFESWKPITKPLKDIRFRLEAVRSKL
ncbi:uncharacterized protein J3D65DRAFT_642228 [Phyllosticta citribraziliensis]|uniref:YMC020W-like alpha/beta hydrolase domain-containing protein n=1 Tax=Phyllosticta citribraziliensis TaxID=989973 RepID=A0ABR1L2P5_9PEZI